MRYILIFLLCLSTPVAAATPDTVAREKMLSADVLIAGEVHDNPHHHQQQEALARQFKPAAIVFEMLSPGLAARVTPTLRNDAEALGKALRWAEMGWPDFAMYHPIFTAAPEARIYGAHLPRDRAREAMQAEIADVFGEDAALYGLDADLPEDQMQARTALQMEAHCNALPEEMLPAMVGIQRLRDATLARAALRALDETDGPVLVITGNGHARKDWGMPAYLERVRPGLAVFSLGQIEEGNRANGTFDMVLSAPPAERPDPCLAFK